MKTVFLIVLFITAANPEPHEADGFGPRIQPDMATCEVRMKALQSYIHRNSIPRAVVACVEI